MLADDAPFSVLAANPRLKAGFSDLLQRQVREAQALWRDAHADSDVRDALVEALDRIHGTAQTLGLPDLADAAGVAADAAANGSGPEALETLVEHCRGLEGVPPVLRPIVVLAANTQVEGRARQQAEGLSGSVRVLPLGPEAVAQARALAPAAVLLPSALLRGAPPEGLDLGGAPFYVYGEGRDLADRLAAVRFGAAGFLPNPLDLRLALASVRARLTASVLGGFRVAVIARTAEDAAALGEALSGDRARVVGIAEDVDLIGALDDAQPDLVALGPGLTRVPAVELLALLRAHHLYGVLPRVLVVEDAGGEAAAMLTDADAVLRRDAEPGALRARVQVLLERARRERALRHVDVESGVLSRVALLRGADREVAAARRLRAPLCVLRVEVDGLSEVRRLRGPGPAMFVEQCLALALRDGVRDTDSIGYGAGPGFAVLLPGCSAANGRLRMAAVRARFKERLAVRPALASLTLSAGVADSAEGFDELLLRAERAMVRARSAGGDTVSGGA